MLHIFMSAIQQPSRRNKKLSMTEVEQVIREAKRNNKRSCIIEGELSQTLRDYFKAEGIRISSEIDGHHFNW